jgi:hypothetical protein
VSTSVDAAPRAPVSFADATATKAGVSTRTVRRAVQIAEGLTEGTKEVIRDTELADRKSDLIKLAQIEEPAMQQAVAAKVVEGQAATVDDAVVQTVREMNQKPAAVRAFEERQQAIDPEYQRLKFYALFEKRMRAVDNQWLSLEPAECADATDEDNIFTIEHIFDAVVDWIAQYRRHRKSGLRVVGGSN